MFTLCSSVVLENILSPSPHGGPWKFQGEGGSKRRQFPRERGGGGALLTVFFLPGDLSKIGESLINNSFSVEQAFSYFTVTGVSKQVVHLLSAVC